MADENIDVEIERTVNEAFECGIGGHEDAGKIAYKIRDSLYLNITNGRIAEASFEARACAPVIAVASLATERLVGLTLDEARELPILELDRELGGLPPSKRHAYLVFLECLQDASEQITKETTHVQE